VSAAASAASVTHGKNSEIAMAVAAAALTEHPQCRIFTALDIARLT
jgi:hypothetical protein